MSRSHAEPAEVRTRKAGEVLVVEISGRLTLASGACDRLRSEIADGLDAGERSFVIDLGSVTKFDSSGFGELVAAHNEVSGRSGAFATANPTPKFLRYLTVHMMNLSIGGGPYDSVEEAIAALEELPPSGDGPDAVDR